MQVVWQRALGSLSGLLAENAGLCESVSLAGPGRLAATFRAKYTSCKAFCERADQLSSLVEALSAAAGGPVTVEFHAVADDPAATDTAGRRTPQRQRMAELSEHPMVRRASELFDAVLIRVEDPEA